MYDHAAAIRIYLNGLKGTYESRIADQREFLTEVRDRVTIDSVWRDIENMEYLVNELTKEIKILADAL